MGPKTLPKPIFERFFGLCFPILNLHCFFIEFLSIVCQFFKARTLNFIAPVEAKRYFLQNRSFEENAKKIFQKPARNPPKTFQNPLKIDKKSKKIDGKRQHDLRCVKKPKKNWKKCETWAQNPPKRTPIISTGGLREALPGSYLEFKKAITIY